MLADIYVHQHFHSLEVVDRVSENCQVSENSAFIGSSYGEHLAMLC